MKHDPIAVGKRKPVNVSIDTGIVAAAREAGVNLSRVTENALRVAIKEAQEDRWREENQDWITAYNAWVDTHGIPLSGLKPL